MALHRFLLRPLSFWGTPLRSDTLTGLLLYRLAEDEGAAALRVELEAIRDGRPSFALSSAMPAGTVFAPRLPPVPRGDFAAMIQSGSFADSGGRSLSLFEALGLFKKFRKAPFLPLSVWERHRTSLSAADLFAEYCRDATPWKNIAGQKTGSAMHVTIDRSTGRALDGGLFKTSFFCGEKGAAFHLYAETDNLPWLLERLGRLCETGIGRDQSTGQGVFALEEDKDFQPPADDLPHRLLLSTLSAEDMSGLRGWYATEVKSGKAGPGFSNGNPFKSPFLCVQEGAVLTELPKGPFLLTGIHSNPDLVQVTHPVTLPCRLAQGEESHG